VGKVKKLVIGIVLIFIISGITVIVMSPAEIDRMVVEQLYGEMTEQELKAIAIDWDYRDVKRNIENYYGEVVFVEGEVTHTQPDFQTITLCAKASEGKCTPIFVDTLQSFLVDDEISGYVQIYGLSKAGDRLFMGTTVLGEYIPDVSDINLTCSNC
jgi:hypothetical protein